MNILTDELSAAFTNVHVHRATAITLKIQFAKMRQKSKKWCILLQL